MNFKTSLIMIGAAGLIGACATSEGTELASVDASQNLVEAACVRRIDDKPQCEKDKTDQRMQEMRSDIRRLDASDKLAATPRAIPR